MEYGGEPQKVIVSVCDRRVLLVVESWIGGNSSAQRLLYEEFGDKCEQNYSEKKKILFFKQPLIVVSVQHMCMEQDYYKVLEVDYDASDETIRLNYRRLALRWHPDKQAGNTEVTAKFQEISEAYQVLSDPNKRLEYDMSGSYEISRYTLREYLTRFKGMILTCNGLGINHLSWSQQLIETESMDQ